MLLTRLLFPILLIGTFMGAAVATHPTHVSPVQTVIACDLNGVMCKLDKKAIVRHIASLCHWKNWGTILHCIRNLRSFFNGEAAYDPQLLPFFKHQIVKKDVLEIIKTYSNNPQIAVRRFSNMVEPAYKLLCEKHTALKLFDKGYQIYTPSNQLRKPNPSTYAALIAAVKEEFPHLTEKNIIFIDDQQKNVTAGQKAGIRSILFTTAAKLAIDLKKQLA